MELKWSRKFFLGALTCALALALATGPLWAQDQGPEQAPRRHLHRRPRALRASPPPLP